MSEQPIVAHHLGVQLTDGSRLLKSLRREARTLRPDGVNIRLTKSYRHLVEAELKAKIAGQEGQISEQDLLAAFGLDENINRVITTNANALCLPRFIFDNGQFYVRAGAKAARLRSLTPNARCEFFIALRSPSSFIPDLLERLGEASYSNFVKGADIRDVLWSDVIASIRNEVPDAPITVWCHEDTPLQWGTILRAITAQPESRVFETDVVMAESLMTEAGINQMRQYLAERPEFDPIQRQRAIAVFLKKFVQEDMLTKDVDLPGWTEEMIEELDETYDHDIDTIAAIDGVTVLTG